MNPEPPQVVTGSPQQFDESQLSFLSKLIYRRVPQAIGFYLAGSWTFLEFFDSLVSRYNMSPHWQDMSLMAIVLLFPTILIIAYRHGAPGSQNWTYFEKVGIPSNLLLALLIIYSQFAAKDLGNSAEMVKGLGPDGSIIELERPKAEFRKRLSIAFFEINDTASDEYLALGIPLALKHDLEQDAYVHVFDPSDLSHEIKRSNYRGLNAPLALMLKIAKSNRIEYLALGDLYVSKGRIILHSRLYNVADSALIKKLKTTDHPDVFTAIDDLSVQIKAAMGFTGGHILHTTDLPITEQLTNSMPAFIAFVKSKHDVAFKDDFSSSETELKKAIELDDSFAAAAAEYAKLLLRQTRTEEGLNMLRLAQKHNYRLTDSNKFGLAAIGSLFNADPASAQEIVNQWIALYPDDADAWIMKYILHRNFNQRILAIAALRKVIKIEPFGTHRHLTIGEIYTSLGDIESALDEYQLFTANNPANARGHLLIGDSNRTLGQFKSARDEYQRAKVLLTNDLKADRRLADLQVREGHFQQAEQQIKTYLQASRIPEDEYLGWSEAAYFYWLRGQLDQSLNAFRNSFAALKTFKPETSYLLTRVQQSWRFAAAGKADEGQKMIDDAKMLLQTSKGKLYGLNLNIAQAMFNAHTGKTKSSMLLIDDVSKVAASYIGAGIDDYIYMFKGIIQYKSKDYINSAVNLESFLEKNPINQTEMMSLMAESLFNSGQIDSARATFEKILEEFPAHPNANFGMAKINVLQEKPELALPYLNKAIQAWEFADNDFKPAISAREVSAKLESI